MKNLALVSLLLTSGFLVTAQTVDTKKINENVSQKNYIGALNEVNNVKKQIQKLATADLLLALPKTIGEYVLQPVAPTGSDVTASLSLQVSYVRPQDPNKTMTSTSATAGTAMPSPMTPMTPGTVLMPGPNAIGLTGESANSIVVLISGNMNLANMLMMAHSGDEMSTMGQDLGEPIRIKGYRALLKMDPYSGATSQMVVGASFVQAIGKGEKDTNLVKSFLEQVDCDKLKAVFGE